MKKILITNPKGGSGKTTLSTNLAGFFASQGRKVALQDLDRQESSLTWLKRRPAHLPFIAGFDRTESTKKREIDICVIDSPAGLRGEKLSEAVKEADWVIVPMQSSSFDIDATHDFLETLRAEKAVRKERTFVAMVGMRVASRTKAANTLIEYLDDSGFPVMGCLRNAQIYALAAEEGLSIFDMTASKAKKDTEQWADLLAWINSQEKETN